MDKSKTQSGPGTAPSNSEGSNYAYSPWVVTHSLLQAQDATTRAMEAVLSDQLYHMETNSTNPEKDINQAIRRHEEILEALRLARNELQENSNR